MLPHFLDQTLFSQYLEKDEKILYVAHKHPLILFRSFLSFLLWGIGVPWFIWASNSSLLWLTLAILFIGWLRFLYTFIIWFFDCWVITNRSIIDVVWTSLFDRKSIRYDFASFEGITTQTRGFFHTILRMGDVMLIRMVDTNQVKLTNAAFPAKIESKVLKAKAEFQANQNQQKNSQQQIISDIITEMVSDYASRRGIRLEE